MLLALTGDIRPGQMQIVDYAACWAKEHLSGANR
jgi:hypothetical protein